RPDRAPARRPRASESSGDRELNRSVGPIHTSNKLLEKQGQGMNSDQPHATEPEPLALQKRAGEAGPREMLPYVAPMFGFLILTSLEGSLPSADWYPIAYTIKVLMVAILAWYFRSTWADLRPFPTLPTLALA